MKTTNSQKRYEYDILGSRLPQEQQPRISIPSIQQETPYVDTLQGKGINGFFATSARAGEVNAITGETILHGNDVIAIIDADAIQEISPQTFKVLIVLLTALKANLPCDENTTADLINKGRIVRIPLAKYMEVCQIKDRTTARQQLNDAIRALYSVSLRWTETAYVVPEGGTRKKKTVLEHEIRLTDHIIREPNDSPVKCGYADFKFSFDMAEYLSHAYVMSYPLSLLTINTKKNPNSIPFGWKLSDLHNQNFGKPTQDTTTVKTLLNSSKGIPAYEKIAASGEIERRIITPFDRDMYALVEAGVLSDYWYYSEDGTPINRDKVKSLSYREFASLNIHYELKGYPDQTPRIEAARQKRIATAKRRSAAAKNKIESADQDSSEMC